VRIDWAFSNYFPSRQNGLPYVVIRARFHLVALSMAAELHHISSCCLSDRQTCVKSGLFGHPINSQILCRLIEVLLEARFS
jgi:hypothetical protein